MTHCMQMMGLSVCAPRNPEPGLKTAYGLCQQMIHFFHQLRLYITFEVIEPAWLHMNARMQAASTLDEVNTLLSAYLWNLSLQNQLMVLPGTQSSDNWPAILRVAGAAFWLLTALRRSPCICDEHQCHSVHQRQVGQQCYTMGLLMLRWADLCVAA